MVLIDSPRGGTRDPEPDACAREPIRIPGGIQPHGALIVLGPGTLRIVQASTNLPHVTGAPIRTGQCLSEHVDATAAADLRAWLEGDTPLFLRTLVIAGNDVQVSAHRSAQGVLVEIEPPPVSESETLEAVYPRLRGFVEAMSSADSVAAIAAIAVRELRALTGFNRVLLYSFDETGDGTVLAEDGDGSLPSYLDLRFPASDIPAQARELYRLNRLRLIPDAGYTPVPLQPADSPVDGRPLDLGLAALRSVSPTHLEYMRNMGTWASMSVSILIDGQLWGLISCHNAAPRRVNAQIRTACDFIGQIASLQIGARERADRAMRRVRLKEAESALLARLAQARPFQQGLAENEEAWRGLVDADGAAILTEEGIITTGATPSEPEIRQLTLLLQRRGVTEVLATDHLTAFWPHAEAFSGTASGLLAISISQINPSYILWFRQEVVRTVRWGGDPRKPPAVDRLNPRRSFDAWKEQVRQRSRPWTDVEVEAARDFRTAVVSFVLRKAEEQAALTEELERSNSELEAFSYSVSHDLRAPFRHIAGYAELLSDRERTLDDKSRHYLNSIVDAALSAGRLVDDLLNFSQLGRASLSMSRVDMGKLIEEVRRLMQPDLAGRNIEWRVGSLPPAWGDGALLRQVWTNLLANAVKFTEGRDPAIIRIEGEDHGDRTVYRVSDNGIGFDQTYVHKLFGVFQRLHRAEEFAGTGIGLALTKRILDRHRGTIAAAGTVNAGASFTFSLPRRGKDAKRV